MPSAHRKQRGSQTAELVAEWYREYGGYPAAYAVGSGVAGKDIRNTPGVAIEVKAVAAFTPAAWTRQAASNAGLDVPQVVLRPNGYGPQSIDQWLVIRTLKNDTFNVLRKHCVKCGHVPFGDLT